MPKRAKLGNGQSPAANGNKTLQLFCSCGNEHPHLLSTLASSSINNSRHHGNDRIDQNDQNAPAPYPRIHILLYSNTFSSPENYLFSSLFFFFCSWH